MSGIYQTHIYFSLLLLLNISVPTDEQEKVLEVKDHSSLYHSSTDLTKQVYLF